jgi:hypothetical protein
MSAANSPIDDNSVGSMSLRTTLPVNWKAAVAPISKVAMAALSLEMPATRSARQRVSKVQSAITAVASRIASTI